MLNPYDYPQILSKFAEISGLLIVELVRIFSPEFT